MMPAIDSDGDQAIIFSQLQSNCFWLFDELNSNIEEQWDFSTIMNNNTLSYLSRGRMGLFL